MAEKIDMEDKVLKELTQWATDINWVRGVILTGSRVSKISKTDAFSDYDIDLFISDKIYVINDDEWLSPFGPIMVRWPLRPASSFHPGWITRLVHFKSNIRIDFQITTPDCLDPGNYDNGFKVLVDKDNITKSIPAPTYTQFNIKKPSAEEFENLVNEFWWDATYVPKYLIRDELPPARVMLDNYLRHQYLHKITEWYIGLNHNWKVNTGVHGRKFKHYLNEQLWEAYTSTYAGSEIKEIWTAFFNLLDLFREFAVDISTKLEYLYPADVDKNVTQYCENFRNSYS